MNQQQMESKDIHNTTSRQRYRIITGAFVDKVIAEQVAKEIKERYGLTAYVIPEHVEKSGSGF
ncbi:MULTISPECIES: SPOR domain-containing protein [Priestia]|uniref:SPOR domain-containing protein n=1 Tax=Priestia TaxID=2800373 RepID=UPI0007629444|nr:MULTISPECIES: hypothetical protein [Priestia]KWU56517.1 hypothetical protein AWX17_26375 [Priestia megaterium]MBX9998288.1 hypothetical protein [Priestia aryabhattai]MCP1452167.1 ribosomal protein S25 [Priestia megaterium]